VRRKDDGLNPGPLVQEEERPTYKPPLRFLRVRVTFGVGADEGGEVRDESESPEV